MDRHSFEQGCAGASAPRSGVVKLSPAEAAVVALVTEGLTNREISERLGKSESTIKSQLRSVYGKLGVKNRIRLMVMLRP